MSFFYLRLSLKAHPTTNRVTSRFDIRSIDKWLKPAITRELRHSRKFGRPTYASHWNKGQVNGSSETWICLLYSLSNQTSCTWIYEKGVNKKKTKKWKGERKKGKEKRTGRRTRSYERVKETKTRSFEFLYRLIKLQQCKGLVRPDIKAMAMLVHKPMLCVLTLRSFCCNKFP